MLLCLIGPAGGGKTMSSERLLADHGSSMVLSVSVTTRAPRHNERDGREYFFVSPEEFAAKVKRGEFFEQEENHGKSYGTLQSTVDQALHDGKDLLLDVDIKGALNFKKRLPLNTVIVFLLPPSPAVMKARLQSRGAIAPAELATRLATARREYAQLLEVADKPGMIDYLVVNDAAEDTYRMLNAIVIAERTRLVRLAREDVAKICALNEL